MGDWSDPFAGQTPREVWDFTNAAYDPDHSARAMPFYVGVGPAFDSCRPPRRFRASRIAYGSAP